MVNFATLESTVIQLRFDLIARVCGANLLALAKILYSKSIITSEELEAIHKETPAVHKDVPKAVSLITTILDKVDADSSVFYQFMSILLDNDHPNLAALLVSDLTTESVYRRHEQLQKLSRKESLAEEQESTQSLLSIRDFVKVCNKLYAASMKWYEIGDILKINKRKLDKIKQQNKSMKTCFFGMVYEWLENGEERTWLALSHSLRSDTVNLPDIADQLEKLSKEECLIEEQETTKPHQLQKLSRKESLVEEQETTKSRGICNLQNALKYVKKRKFPSSKAEALGHALKTVSYIRILDIMAKRKVHECFQLALIDIVQHWLDNEPQPEWEKLAKALDGNYAVVAKVMRGCSGKPITLGDIMLVLLNYGFSTSTNLGEVLALKLEVPYDTICANRGLTSKFDMALMDILEAWFDSDLDPSWYKLDQALQETDQKELSIKDFAKVCNRLYAARMKWYEIGIMLKIDARKLYTIKQQNKATKAYFFEMVYEWLVNGEERTWLALSHSLRSEIVQFPEIADQLQKLSGEESLVEEQETAKSQLETLSITNLDEVRDSLYDARTMWYEIGIGLHIDKTTLNEIKETYRLVDSCFEKMLEEWLNNGVNRTWATLVRAVGSKIVGYSDTTAHLTKVPAESVEKSTCKDSSTFWSNQLSYDDLENIYETVYEARKKWYMIGVMLRIGVDKLDKIKRKFGEAELCLCFKEMLKVWLNSSSERTWRILAAVLRSDCIGFSSIADEMSAGSLETSFTANSCHLNITNLPEIYDILYRVREKWEEIGIQLKFDLDTLDIIGDEFDDPEHCLLELLKKWLHNSIDTTWYTLTDCIQKIISYLVKSQDPMVTPFSHILNLLKRKILNIGEVPPKPCNQISANNLPEICECMYMAFSKWQAIGRVLQISEGALNDIKGKINGHAECFVHMIMKWLKVSINPNWMALAHACTVVGYPLISSTLLQMSSPSDKQHLKASPQLLDTLSHNAKQKWYMIGMKLRLDTATLDVIKMEADDQAECFKVMIKKWKKKPNSSLSILVGVLQSEIVDYPAIANELLEETVDYTDSPTSLDSILPSQTREISWQVARVICLYLGIIIFFAISFGHPVQEQDHSMHSLFDIRVTESPSSGNQFGLELSEVHNKGINGTGIKLAIIDLCYKGFEKSNGIFAGHKALQRDSNDIQIDEIDCDIDDSDDDDYRDHALICTSVAVGSRFSGPMIPNCVDYGSVTTYPGGVAPGANTTVYLTARKNLSSVIIALNKVHEGMFDVLSLSLGYEEEIPSIKQAIDNLKSRTIIIAAAGNYGNIKPVMFPASHPDVISVGAMDVNFKPLPDSANNALVNTFYFGEMYVPSSDNDNSLLWNTGTSLAAPGIAGIVSLIIQSAKKHGYYPEIKNKSIIMGLLDKFMTIEVSKTYVPNSTFLVEAHQNKEFFETLLSDYISCKAEQLNAYTSALFREKNSYS